ncbi:MAG: MGH1-like glycoside hydrolase domain-containing protein [Bacteroidota bacterium]
MRDWSLSIGDPLYMTLAADSRLCTPDYVNDHIWELEFGSGEPAALTLRTTYGMRARSMRIFLRFTEDGKSVLDPAAFPGRPVLRRFYPNFLVVDFTPLDNLPCSAEFWIPDSQTLSGRITLTNRSTALRQVQLEVCALLAPLDGQGIAGIQQQLVNILAGQTGGLFPVLFMTGGPKHGPGPYSSLALDLDLGPGATRQLTFAEAAREALAGSFEQARHTAARAWEAERARIELLDTASTVDIETGDMDWDAALAFSQRAALGLLFSGSQQLPRPSYVSVRQPDHGFSRKGDGTDYAPAWSGQTPLETYYLASLLPGYPAFARGALLNFLSTQAENGEVDGKPGLARQRSRLLAAPMLAALAWSSHLACDDATFLEEVYPRLHKFFWSWFAPEHDFGHDGIPEWDHLLQTGFEDNPLFDVWHPWSQGVDITTVHTPALASMLYREAVCLMRIAKASGMIHRDPVLKAQAETLRAAVEESWKPENALYSYLDRDTRTSPAGEELLRGEPGENLLRPKLSFEKPVRIQVIIEASERASKKPQVEIGEFVTKGEPEVIEGKKLQWRTGGLVATSQKVYTRLGRVKVRGLGRKDTIIVRTVDLTPEDHTLLLPIWAGIPDRRRVHSTVQRTILAAERFGRPFGMPALPALPAAEAETIGTSVHLPWNQLIAEGLLDYGFRTEAARLTALLMNAVILSLKQTRSFYQRYHAESGSGIGERNALSGFAPVGLFLRSLGVTYLAPDRVRLEGKNPYPWPVTLRYKGLVVVRNAEETAISFPNGATASVKQEEPVVVEAGGK